MNETQKIQWKRISVEAAAIVISILLAFSIDAWWTDRQDRTREAQLIKALTSEFEGNLVRFNYDIDVLRTVVSDLQDLVSRLSSVGESDEVTVPNRHFFAIRYAAILDASTGTLDAMISSGDFDLVQDESLRSELSEWMSRINEIATDQHQVRTFTSNELIPYLGSLSDYSTLVLAERSELYASDDLTPLRSTNRLRTSFAFRLLMTEVALGKFEILVTQTETILGLLKEAQPDAGL